MRIIYMGTPEFAVEPLKTLVEAGYKIVAVVTIPDKPAGRGQKLQASPVKEYAVAQGLKVLQPEKLKGESFISELQALKADLQIVVAFRMLPEIVWAMPPMGTVNLHASLLPQYRGAAPINHAIINGETVTGITTFFIEKEIDTGNLIYKEEVLITDTDCAGTLHDKLMYKGAELILKTVKAIENKSITPVPQNNLLGEVAELKPAPKIFKDDCRINWHNNGKSVYNFIRGLSPYPAAFTQTLDKQGNMRIVKIYETVFEPLKHTAKIGDVISDQKSHIKIAVTDGYISLLSLQMEGKKRMDVKSFLNGMTIDTIITH